ncbi:MAG: arylsulfatase [Anaerolineae bacterium]|jgi:arylsulfatase A-like enzyme|nr:arylsulfatase [Anaerolineae bacterium]
MSDTRPNILFLHADQWRADALGFAGDTPAETPHLDSLFDQGVAFSQAYAACPSCIASRASLHTGLSPRSHGRVGYMDAVPWTYETTMAGLLAGGGYHTQAVGKMHVYPPRNLVGFHNVVLHDGYLHQERRGAQDMTLVDDYLPWLRAQYGPAADYIDTGVGCNGYVTRPWLYDDMLHPTAWVTSQSIDFLRRRDPTRPFFLYTSYHRPHPPLDPPEAYFRMYEHRELPPPIVGDWNASFPMPSRGLDSPSPTDPIQRERARRAYYAQITFIDHQINRLIHALHAHDVLDNTVILFCSDHGEMLYDHGLVAKSLPYDASARVPFLLRFPPSMGFLRRSTVDVPIEMRDVLPTLCDVAGVEVPASIEGRSVLPFCRGEAPAWRSYVHGEHTAGRYSNQWLTDGVWKAIWYSQTGIEQLFNLREDPKETRNLADTYPDLLADWRMRLIVELTGREEGYVQGGSLVVGRPPQPLLRA